MTTPVTIIGAGLAGVSLARELRKRDREQAITLLSADDADFYAKPMLSNALAAGKTPEELVQTPRHKLAEQLNITIHAGVRVSAIDTGNQTLLSDQGTWPYQQLVLALGAAPIRLPLKGSGAADVLSVNHLHDYAVFRQRLAAGADLRHGVAILGGGLIGCEFANDLSSAGIPVKVFDLAPQALGRLLPELAADYFAAKLGAVGVHFQLATVIQQIDRSDDGYVLTDAEGRVYRANLVLSAVGLKPATEMAKAAGMQVNRGIVTDKLLATSAGNVYALGDCAEVAGQSLPFVMPIMQQARALAQTLGGQATPVRYPAMPVVVKTPACPTVVCPPNQGDAGRWQVDQLADGVRAVFTNNSGLMTGFALLGSACAEKQALTAKLPDIF